MAKVPEGEMTRAEIVRLVKKYNEKMGIDPKGKSRDQLIKEIEKLKYKIDHEKKDLVLQIKQKVKKQPRNVKADPIKKKTELQIQKATERKEEKEREKKKELRKIKKEIADKIINREKKVKDKTTNNNKKKDMKKEDDVRPKEKVGRPKVDPNKIKVIVPKKKPKKVEKKVEKKTTPKKKIVKNKLPFLEELKETDKSILEDSGNYKMKKRCGDFVDVSKYIIKAEKNKFKKVRIFKKDDVDTDIINVGGNNYYNNATPLLIIYNYFYRLIEDEKFLKRIKDDCGVRELLFVEKAYKILFDNYDLIKKKIIEQNKKYNPNISIKKLKDIEFNLTDNKKER